MPEGTTRGDSLRTSVREDLVRRLEAGEWRPSERLPSEPDLAASLGVSRATLRDALRSLEEDGFVTRVQGSGTFVTHRPRLRNNVDVVPGWLLGDGSALLERTRTGSVYHLLERQLGVVIRQGVATSRPANADAGLAARLQVPAGTLLLYLLQVDYDLDGRPVLLSHEHHLADAFEIAVVRRGPGPSTK